MVEITRRKALAGFVGLLGFGAVAGGNDGGEGDTGSGGDEKTQTATPTATATPAASPKEQVREAAVTALQSDSHLGMEGIKRAEYRATHDGEMLHIYYDYNVTHDAEDDKVLTDLFARSALTAVLDVEDRGDVTGLALYAKVPTADGGETTLSKVVWRLADVADRDWSEDESHVYVEDEAEQYKFNDYLY